MQILYDIVVVLLMIVLLPYFIVRLIREKGFGERMKQSFGFLPKHALDKVAGKDCIWVHAASVGEIVAASPLVKEFRREFPEIPILISVVTCSGYTMANRIIKDADSIIYFPLDLPFLADHTVKKIKPRIFLPVETELWPNLLKAARRYDVAVMMVNGRISDKSVNRYRYMFSLLSDMVGTVNKFAMQSEIDASYIIRLGADPKLVAVTGNTKFDQTYTNVSAEGKKKIIAELGLDDAEGIIIAGSTHKGEEVYVLDAFMKLRNEFPKVKLIIAPRKIIRKDDVKNICEQRGFKTAFRTDLKKRIYHGHDIVILDTIGELGKIYSVGDVIYIGGSLVPHGGHNILEPAAHGKAIIVGKNMFNFKDTYMLFKKRDACLTVNNSIELAQQMIKLFRQPEIRHQMEVTSLAIIHENQGASRRSAVILRQVLEELDKNHKTLAVPSTEAIENLQTYLFELVHGRREKHVVGYLIIFVLDIFSFIYEKLVNLKLWLYQSGILKRQSIDCYVISIGNITVGGTGKTPTSQRLAKEISNIGYKVAILNRGYRAKWHGDVGVVSDGRKLLMTASQAGDEAFLLAKNLPDVPVLIGPDRSLTGEYAIENFGVEVAILDDGYQHWQLKRNMDILLVDSINIFGNEHILPRGTLRESLSHLDRADVCLLTKVDQATPHSREYIRKTLSQNNDHALIVESIHNPMGFVEIGEWSDNIGCTGKKIVEMVGCRIMVVSAIGNPASVEQTLQSIGTIIVESIRFPDHHDYSLDEIAAVMKQAEKRGAEAIVITDKDAVKFPQEIIQEKNRIPIYIISIEIKFKNGAEEFYQYIKEHLPPLTKHDDQVCNVRKK
ncbi:tetraacyldisaccharide 4'-kinase [Pectinatus frisingensis]|uniref:tetraacyldisaccharide 4'-kinase n=1 Tax=Pectinatus frisingensis TaxID=865 RepID=UPI0018C58A34|nr:tetraacyldisaccharide 4'-kinase [Pectinatus frisingensis]